MVSYHPHDDAAGPFGGLDDAQVLERAIAALRRVHGAPFASVERSIAWAAYEHVKAELDMRLYRHALRKIEEGK